jgi:hypothetical protein
MKEPTTIIKVLERAKALLLKSPGKWIQGNYTKRVKGRQCFCAVGSVYHVAGYDVMRDEGEAPELARAAVNALTDVLRTPYLSVEDWNDDPRRTFPQVVRLFDKAIVKERKRKT